jgi:hypothetical protein
LSAYKLEAVCKLYNTKKASGVDFIKVSCRAKRDEPTENLGDNAKS